MERFEQSQEQTEQQLRNQEDFHRNLHESAESAREPQGLDEASEKLRQIDGLRPEVWQKMDLDERRAVMNQAGEALESTYHTPRPPLDVQDFGNPAALGSYGDGYQYNPDTGSVEGADYKISMNEQGVRGDQALLCDDPREALRTYAHEFRHSYQSEQATRWEKPQFRNLVDTPDEASDWSVNNRNYVRPEEGYEAYRSQPVERDARAFADALVESVYR